MKKRWAYMGAAAVLALGVTGCAESIREGSTSSDSTSPKASPSRSASATPSTEAAVAPAEARPSPTESRCFSYYRADSLVREWDDILETRGYGTHERMLERFEEDVTELVKDNRYDSRSCIGSVEMAGVGTEIVMLSGMVGIVGEVDDDLYVDVVRAGNEWLEVLGREDLAFQMP